jgi:hypothetical protein
MSRSSQLLSKLFLFCFKWKAKIFKDKMESRKCGHSLALILWVVNLSLEYHFLCCNTLKTTNFSDESLYMRGGKDL